MGDEHEYGKNAPLDRSQSTAGESRNIMLAEYSPMKSSDVWKVTEEVWLYPGESAAWHFLTVPKGTAAVIKERYGKVARGWGSLPVQVTIGETVFETSIFPDKRSGGYLLPLKAAVRTAEGIRAGMRVTVSLVIRPNRGRAVVK